MRRAIKTAVAAGVMATAILGTTAVPAGAWVSVGQNTQYPAEGGTWNYGFWNVYLRSYYNVNKCHGSTAQRFIDGNLVNQGRSVDTAGGATSVAEVYTLNSPGLSARYYYRTC